MYLAIRARVTTAGLPSDLREPQQMPGILEDVYLPCKG
jgi:hypothetical protein